MKKLIYILVGLAVAVGSVLGANYVFVGAALTDAIRSDPRNAGIEASAHYENYMSPSVLVFNLNKISENNSPADVFRVFLQYSERMKNKSFDRVMLAHNGKVKYQIKGEYFKMLGVEFEDQNPIYTIRTFPENLSRPDGTQAFGTWTGGILGVLAEQMNDFNKFHQEWYLDDIASTATE